MTIVVAPSGAAAASVMASRNAVRSADVGARREDLFELVDGEHRVLSPLAQRITQRIERMVARSDHGVGPPIAARKRARSECMHESRTQQGGLPTPRGSDEREEPSPDEVTDRLCDHLLPTEEEPCIDRLEPCESLVRAHIGWTHGLRTWRPTAFELGVVGEDRRLESLQLGARLDPELADQHLPGAREGLECLGLTPGSVQRDHQLTPPPLAQRLLSDHRLELGDELARIRTGEPRVDEVFGGRSSKLVEPIAFGRAEARVPVALVGGASPQTERLFEHWIGLCRAPGIEESMSFDRELLEADRVDLVTVALERVAVRTEDDDVHVRAGRPTGLEVATKS